MVKFRVGLWSAYLLSHPDDVKHVLQDNYQNYRKGFTFEYLKPLLGLGLLTNEGEPWLTHRRLIQPAFHHERLDHIVERMTAGACTVQARWRKTPGDEAVDVVQEMTGLTLQIVSQALLGVDVGGDAERISEAVKTAQEHINWRLTHLFSMPDRYPTPRNLEFRRALHVLDDVVYDMIRSRRAVDHDREDGLLEGAERASRDDVLTLLLEAQDEDPEAGITDLVLRDETMTLFLAGHETTANALAWTWHFLALNPEVEEQLHAEVDSVLNGRTPALADLPRLQYTRMVFEETLRLRPPVWLIGRFPTGNDSAGGFRIPAHASVLLSPFVTHRHPDFWTDPERFDPQHFAPDQVLQRPKGAYFPFGLGPRMCIGGEFAIIEGVISLAMLAGEFRLRPSPRRPVELEPLITLRPKGGLEMFIEPRS